MVLTWSLGRLVSRENTLSLDWLDLTVLALVVAYLLSLVHPASVPEAVAGTLKVVSCALLYLVLSRSVERNDDAAAWMAVVFWTSVVVAIVGLGAATGYLYFPGAFDGHSIMSTFQYRNTLAAYLAAVSLCGVALQSRRWAVFHQASYGVGLTLVFVTILCSQSRGGWIVFPLGCLLYLLFLSGPYLYRSLYGLLLSFGIAVFTTRSFLPAVIRGDGRGALLVLGIGVAAAVAAHLVVHCAGMLVERLADPRVRRAIIVVAAFYVALTFVVYVAFASQAFPSLAARFLPSTLLARIRAISGQEPSFQQRLIFSRDAFNIFRDHLLFGAGGGGWNALYHRYQLSQYFTTEVHNHFLQTAVEAGLLGLAAFTATWFCLGRALLVIRRGISRQDTMPEETWPLAWAAGAAAFVLGAHSAFDFNLSLPAVFLTLWALMAVVRGMYPVGEPDSSTLMPYVRRSPGGQTSSVSRPAGSFTWPRRNLVKALRGWPLNVLAGALGVCLILISHRFYTGGVLGAQGAQALVSHDLVKARGYYEAARRYDPYTASYAVDLAQTLTKLGLIHNDEDTLQRALDITKEAVRLEPNSPQIRAAASLVYMLQGYVDEAVKESEAIIGINPWDVTAYEGLGKAYISGALYYRRFGFEEEAKWLLEKACAIPTKVEAVSARRDRKAAWQGPALEVTPTIDLNRGQAAYLLGDHEAAVRILSTVYEGTSELKSEVAPWLAAALTRAGRTGEADKILEAIPSCHSQFRQVLAQ